MIAFAYDNVMAVVAIAVGPHAASAAVQDDEYGGDSYDDVIS